MEVRIGKSKYYVKSDKFCYTLMEKKVAGAKSTRAGQEWFEDLGYYRHMKDVLHELVNLRVAVCDRQDFESLFAEVQSIHKMIDENLKCRHWVQEKKVKS